MAIIQPMKARKMEATTPAKVPTTLTAPSVPRGTTVIVVTKYLFSKQLLTSITLLIASYCRFTKAFEMVIEKAQIIDTGVKKPTWFCQRLCQSRCPLCRSAWCRSWPGTLIARRTPMRDPRRHRWLQLRTKCRQYRSPTHSPDPFSLLSSPPFLQPSSTCNSL